MKESDRNRSGARAGLAALALFLAGSTGCHVIPIVGRVDTDSAFRGKADIDARVTAAVQGPIEIKMPTAPDPGPMLARPVRAGNAGPAGPRIGLVDVDGIILNQNMAGLYSVGENPVAAFRGKLEAAAADPRVQALVVRINSPGGSVTACDILAEELRRYREGTRKPVVCCLMDLGTSGAYYLASGGNRIIAHPTTVTGGIGSLINRYNLEDAMAQLNVVAEPIRSAPLVDMGSITSPLPEEAQSLLQEMADGFATRFRDRVRRCRPVITPKDWEVLADGRVVPANKALEMHLIDRIGYVDDAIAEAEGLAGVAGSEVVLFQRQGYPAQSIYSITPNSPIQGQLIPFSYPGLDRAKLPTFLYLWAPDPTLLPQVAR